MTLKDKIVAIIIGSKLDFTKEDLPDDFEKADQIISLFKEIIPKEKDKIEINPDFNDGYKIGFNEAINEIKSKLR